MGNEENLLSLELVSALVDAEVYYPLAWRLERVFFYIFKVHASVVFPGLDG